MPSNVSESVTWTYAKRDVIILANTSTENFILELPTGRYRLDAGRRMRTLNSILKFDQVRALVDDGKLLVEKS